MNDNGQSEHAETMDRAAFELAADAYGGDLSLWPADRRAAAETLLAADPEAAAVLAAAAALDRRLEHHAAASRIAMRPDFAALLMADATVEAAASARRADVPAPAAARSEGGWRRSLAAALGVEGFSFGELATGGVVGAAAAAGLAIGLAAPISATPPATEAERIAAAGFIEATLAEAWVDDEWGDLPIGGVEADEPGA